MCKTFFQRITFLESRQIWTEMIIIDTIVGPSTVAGSGIFANEDVKNGDVVWMLHPSLDSVIPFEDMENLPEYGLRYVRTYVYWSPNKKAYILCGDNSKHFNHSNQANTKTLNFDGNAQAAREYYLSHAPHSMTESQLAKFDFTEGFTIASRDIKKGEEIFSNYNLDFPDEGPANLYKDDEWIKS